MVCKKCGKQFEGAFCPYCGEKAGEGLPSECPVCGNPRKEDEIFCSKCGYSFRLQQEPQAINSKPVLNTNKKDKTSSVKDNAMKVFEFIKRYWKPITAAAVILVVALIVIIPTAVHFANIFRTDKVDEIEIGMTKSEVVNILGDPHDSSSGVYEWYSDNYLKLKEKLDSLDAGDIDSFEDFGNAFEEEEKLREEMRNTEYSYIRIFFNSDGQVTEVFYDSKRTESGSSSKSVKEYSLISGSVYKYEETTLNYRAVYTDGSLIKAFAARIYPDDPYYSYYSVEWTDIFGNKMSTSINVQDNPDILLIGACGENATYLLDSDGVMTVSGTGIVTGPDDHNVREAEALVIAEGITAIADEAFDDLTNISAVELPVSLTVIGNNAFNCEKLVEVKYQGDLSGWLGIELGSVSANPMYYADNFYINGELLQGEIVIPEGTEKIGEYAFYNCSGLTSITIPDSVTSIGDDAFRECSGLTSITIPDSVTSIGDDAFRGCSLTSIEIPNSVTEMGRAAFAGCELTKISMPARWGYIGGLFGVTYYESNDMPDCVKEVIITGGESIGEMAFYRCSSLTSITISDSVTDIGEYAFDGCSGLTSITIPDSVTSIGEYAFRKCSGLTSISIPFVGANADGTGSTRFEHLFGFGNADNVPDSLKEVIITGGESIADNAFEGCTSLTTITIPGTVTELGDDVFAGCTSLEKIIFQGTIEQWKALESSSRGNDKLIVECTDGRYRFFVTYDLDGGVTSNPSSYNMLTLGGADGSMPLSASSKVEILSYTSNGDGSFEVTQNVYTFLGWYKDASFEQKVTSLTLDLGDVTLYAKWSEQPAEVQTETKQYVRVNKNNEGDAQGEYILFGWYPQTIKSSDVTVGDVADEDGYYLGSDGERYAKVVADPYGSGYTFSDGSKVTDGNIYYFKVEPIRWRILSESGGSAFILADGIIANHYYHHTTFSTTIEGETVFANNYKHSDIRAWLNGEFLNTAFGEVAQDIIETTEVDNSVYSTGYSSNQYACENTFDKVFLLSYREVTNSEYGFASSSSTYDTARRMTVSDYARSTGTYINTSSSYFGCGYWWLRSPFRSSGGSARDVGDSGCADYRNSVNYGDRGVVPALNITL